MNVETIPLAQIDVGARLRAIDPDNAAVIAASMQEIGQRQPIEVRKVAKPKDGRLYVLVTGAHRMKAMEIAGIEEAQAIVVKASEIEAQLLEIDENLCRHELNELDRATFLAKRKEVYEALHPETKHGGDRKSDQVLNLEHLIQSFTKATADKLGLSRQTIDRSISRYNNIAPDVREKIAGTWVSRSGSQLDALAKHPPEMQRKIVEMVIKYPEITKITDAVREITKTPAPKPPTSLEKFLTGWRKMDSRARLGALHNIRSDIAQSWQQIWHSMSEEDRDLVIQVIAPELPGGLSREAA
ncbi:ParB N-terminal domain-containing protein [Acetobacter sicerae]|uniref:ParB N-terminal domain-containing protein n=1 Tax=Acetobacter sicerae TaxID=85325 RepID=A0ABS8W220_9PROT|nr:ParB N-terminal domain-containing protein [Acetobacter sicerae]MCE0745552.1 ParB N-terminal domain-containing protein [Acetobacter sicerae]